LLLTLGNYTPKGLKKIIIIIIIHSFLFSREVITLEAATVADIANAVESSCLCECIINIDVLFGTTGS